MCNQSGDLTLSINFSVKIDERNFKIKEKRRTSGASLDFYVISIHWINSNNWDISIKTCTMDFIFLNHKTFYKITCTEFMSNLCPCMNLHNCNMKIGTTMEWSKHHISYMIHIICCKRMLHLTKRIKRKIFTHNSM